MPEITKDLELFSDPEYIQTEQTRNLHLLGRVDNYFNAQPLSNPSFLTVTMVNHDLRDQIENVLLELRWPITVNLDYWYSATSFKR